MLKLPAKDSALRSFFDVAHLADLGSFEMRAKLPTFRDGFNIARNSYASDPAATSVNVLVLRATGDLWLCKFNHTGSWKRLWNFGKI